MTVVTEFMPQGSLHDVLRRNILLPLTLRLKMGEDAARGMNYLHTINPPVIHRDLKSQNLLVDENFNVKVTDFGLAKFQKKGIPTFTSQFFLTNVNVHPSQCSNTEVPNIFDILVTW